MSLSYSLTSLYITESLCDAKGAKEFVTSLMPKNTVKRVLEAFHGTLLLLT